MASPHPSGGNNEGVASTLARWRRPKVNNAGANASGRFLATHFREINFGDSADTNS